MRTREARHNAIIDIIKNNKIKSQETLLQYIHDQGFPTTQATLSRDLAYLQISKTADGRGGYFYSLPDTEQQKTSEEKFLDDIRRGFLSLEFSGNLGVIKTLPGHANSVAFALDNLELEEVLGTMAGDDTILVVLHEHTTRDALYSRLYNLIPELERIV